MKKRKWIAFMLTAAMVIGSLTACGSSNTEDEGTSAPSSGTEDSAQGETSGSADSTGYVTPAEPVTIKFLHKGPEPDGWDAVYEKYLEMTRDTLNIELDITWVEHADYKEKLNLEITSGSEWDLVFDASWVQLRNLAPEGYYADLSGYFNNSEEYPGLAAAFSPETMESNIWFDSMCYIPLY